MREQVAAQNQILSASKEKVKEPVRVVYQPKVTRDYVLEKQKSVIDLKKEKEKPKKEKIDCIVTLVATTITGQEKV